MRWKTLLKIKNRRIWRFFIYLWHLSYRYHRFVGRPSLVDRGLVRPCCCQCSRQRRTFRFTRFRRSSGSVEPPYQNIAHTLKSQALMPKDTIPIGGLMSSEGTVWTKPIQQMTARTAKTSHVIVRSNIFHLLGLLSN